MVLILAVVISALFIPWPWNLVVVLLGAIAEVGEVVWARAAVAAEVRSRENGRRDAEVVVPCRPSGQVRVHGEIWEARCASGARSETMCGSPLSRS